MWAYTNSGGVCLGIVQGRILWCLWWQRKAFQFIGSGQYGHNKTPGACPSIMLKSSVPRVLSVDILFHWGACLYFLRIVIKKYAKLRSLRMHSLWKATKRITYLSLTMNHSRWFNPKIRTKSLTLIETMMQELGFHSNMFVLSKYGE